MNTLRKSFCFVKKKITTGMVTSKVGKRYAFTGFDALKELFLMRLASSSVFVNFVVFAGTRNFGASSQHFKTV